MTEFDGRWRRAILSPEATIGDAIRNLDDAGLKLSLCVDANDKLVGAVTDGDVRRGLLRGLTMQDPIQTIMQPNPLVVPEGTERDIVRAMMQVNRVLQVPVVDATGCLVGLHLWHTLDETPAHDHAMIIMAGGKGTRLRPYTEKCPKPMLPVAGKPMLEHIIERAKLQGFVHFVLSLNYLGQMIRDHFKDGSEFGVRIDYVEEEEPLGTAGALSLLAPRPGSAFIVVNGDVLTDIDFRELIDFRERHDAQALMAVRMHEWTNPFGVVQMEGVDITGFAEKPVSRSHINAGVYAFAPSALDYLEPNKHCDMPTLFERLRHDGKRTVAYPLHEPWLDVGRPDDLEKANAAMDVPGGSTQP